MTSNLVLEGEILLIVFAEVHGFGPMGNALAGIVTKPHASRIIAANAALGAKDGIVIQFCAERAVGAGFFDFFSEEHLVRLFSHNN